MSHLNYLRITLVTNAPHISNTDRIRDLLIQHLEIDGLEYVPEETYSTGPESESTEVHLMMFKSPDIKVFVRVGVCAITNTVQYLQTTKST